MTVAPVRDKKAEFFENLLTSTLRGTIFISEQMFQCSKFQTLRFYACPQQKGVKDETNKRHEPRNQNNAR